MNALIIVDVQNDFCPGGALAVEGGNLVVPVINRILPAFDIVVATQDWHPANHGSFASNHPGHYVGDTITLKGLQQILWPVHCVQETPGADFHPELDTSGFDAVFRKGTDPDVDSYSGFFDNHDRHDTGLNAWLKGKGVTAVYVCGLATDYCVKWTALDALRLGYSTYVISDATRGVNLQPQDSQLALDYIVRDGGHIITSIELPGEKWE